MSFSILFILCLFVSLCHGIEYPNSLVLRDEKYKAHWKFDNETDMFYFKVEVMNVTGWVAFGISRVLYPPDPDEEWNFNSMEYYDVIVGGVYDNASWYYKDCLTDGYKPPKPDAKQDWEVTNLTEANGMVTMEFNRKQNTNDAEGDNVIGPGLRRIVWAYHDTSDDIDTKWQKHNESGFQEIALLEEPKLPAVREVYNTPPSPTTGAGMITASVIANLLLIIIVVIFFY